MNFKEFLWTGSTPNINSAKPRSVAVKSPEPEQPSGLILVSKNSPFHSKMDQNVPGVFILTATQPTHSSGWRPLEFKTSINSKIESLLKNKELAVEVRPLEHAYVIHALVPLEDDLELWNTIHHMNSRITFEPVDYSPWPHGKLFKGIFTGMNDLKKGIEEIVSKLPAQDR